MLSCHRSQRTIPFESGPQSGDAEGNSSLASFLEPVGEQLSMIPSKPKTSTVLSFPQNRCDLLMDGLAEGLPGGASGRESACQCRRHRRGGFGPWVRKIPWRVAAHSRILAWRILWTKEPGRLQSIGSQSGIQLKRLSTHAGALEEVFRLQPTQNFCIS